MPITQRELAERWGLSPGRISQLVAAGMPLDSLEASEEFRLKRHQSTGIAPSGFQVGSGDPLQPEEPTAINPDGFSEVLERQRYLVKVARSQYMAAVRDKSPQQSRLYASYDKTIQTLTKLEKESRERAIASREYIRTEHAVERFSKILAEIRQIMEQGELEVAPEANPSEPGKAMKAYRKWKEKSLATLARAELKAKEYLDEQG
jgi:hypothetical protein